ncbi:MAG: TraB/GumN family protein [Gammaproteobacteria bacterium]|nr:TraB/GumN family protein [Gammaproteobacteria bacterium]
MEQTPAATDEPVRELTWRDCRITLLGTAHVSSASTDTARELAAAPEYDALAVELCPSRHRAMTDPDALGRLDLLDVLRRGQAPMVIATLALGAFQQRVAERAGIEPGAELRALVDEAGRSDRPLLLLDREIGTTLRRTYRAVPFWQRLNLVAGLLGSVVSRAEVDPEEIERLKQGDVLDSAFGEFAAEAGDLYRPLIDERDRYMAARLREAIETHGYRRLLAVVGAGHLAGVERYLGEDDTPARTVCSELDTLPTRSRWWRHWPWAITVLVLLGFGIGFSRSPDLGWSLVADWVLINGTLSALGALLAAAHPYTILTAFVAAPLTSLNPTVGAGMVTGIAELLLRRPTVADFGSLRTMAAHAGGWWRNRITRVLLVFLFSTLGSAAGTWIAGFRIVDRLAG